MSSQLSDPFGSFKGSVQGHGLVMVMLYVNKEVYVKNFSELPKLPEYFLNCCWRHHSGSLLFCASGFLECLFQICSHVTFVFQYLEAECCQNIAILIF